MKILCLLPFFGLLFCVCHAHAQQTDQKLRIYENRLRQIKEPKPLLNDHPEFFEPIIERTHFESPPLVIDEPANLNVRAWRFPTTRVASLRSPIISMQNEPR